MKLANISGVDQAVETLEAIDYQRNDPFGPALEVIVGEFVEMVKKDTPSKYIEGSKELKDKFNKVVLERTGINVYLITDKLLAATMPNVYNPNSILVLDGFNEDLNGEYNSLMGAGLLYNKPSNFKVGTVDYKRARIGGWFSEQPVPLFCNFIDQVNEYKMTVPEITAIILHELGHDFEGAAMCFRINTSNQVIADAVKRISDIEESKRTEYVYKELSKVSPDMTKEDVEGLSSSNPVVMGVSAFRAIIGCVKSLSNSKEHDVTTYEALSDSFAVRFGYGKYLASGLDKMINDPMLKITTFGLNAFFATIFSILLVEIFKLLSVLWMMKNTPKSLIKVGLGVLISVAQRIIVARILLNNERESTRDMTYDLDKDRFIRLRNDLVNALKDPEIDVKTRRATLEQIKFVDTVINRSQNIRGFINLITLVLSPKDRGIYNAIKSQQEIEKMIANDIFVSVSKLKAQ